jgi:urea transport system substrate-binding protein
MELTRRNIIKGGLSTAFVFPAPFLGATRSTNAAGTYKRWITGSNTIKIGFLWSSTGNTSIIEKASLDVARYWTELVNKAGGVAGFQIEPVVIDAKSDMKRYRDGAIELLQKKNVLAIFGGYTSASRRAIMPLVEINEGLLFYPTCYEGRECWQRIICTGPIANQHSLDLIPYMFDNYGPRVYFVGSNYVWPHESNRNAKRWLSDIGGEVVDMAYMPLGQGEFGTILDDIRNKAPDWIFSTVVGDSDLYFRKQYVKAKFTPDKLPTASLTTSEMEVKRMGYEFGEGHILSAPYFQSLNNPCNNKFVQNFLNSSYGESGVTHYNMEETLLSFLYFQKALEAIVKAGKSSEISPKLVRSFCGDLTLGDDESPEGRVKVDPQNFNSWLTPKIGIFNERGQIDLLHDNENWIQPIPYMLYPSRGICEYNGLRLPNGDLVKSAS